MATLYTPVVEGQPNRSATFNAALDSMEASILARAGNLVRLTAWTTLTVGTPSISIPIVAGNYGLQLMLSLRSDRAANSDDSIRIKINSDGASTYQTTYMKGGSGTTYSITTGFQIDFGAAAVTSTSGLFAYSIVKFNRASDAAPRAGRFDTVHQATTGTAPNFLEGATWYPTSAAISSLQIVPVNGSNFVAGSQYALYGTP